MPTTSQNRYGSLIFCPRCGNLLDLPADDDEIVCEGCGKVEDAAGAFFFSRCESGGAGADE